MAQPAALETYTRTISAMSAIITNCATHPTRTGASCSSLTASRSSRNGCEPLWL